MNTTRGWKDMAGSTGPTLRFRPEVEVDFGTVACWAVNDVGRQRQPCLFRISAAGPPDSLTDCSLLNQTADSIHVACQPSSDGGSKQTFQLQVHSHHIHHVSDLDRQR